MRKRGGRFSLQAAAILCMWVSTGGGGVAAPASSPAISPALSHHSARGGEVVLRPAVDGVLAAFKSHPLVGLGEHHALAQEGDFYVALVSDPRFAETVGNVVVEFGSAAHQDILDRYLAGEDVPYPELRRVWTDVVGWYPAVAWTMYVDFFAQVRLVNARLPAEKRIKVWLADPALDWQAVRTREDLKPYQASRDTFGAQLIEREILSPGRKALVIYGYPHFQNFFLRNTGVEAVDTVWAQVARKHPDAFYVIKAHVGLPDKACSTRFEARIKDWTPGTLAAPVKGTWLADDLYDPACPGLPQVLRPPGAPEPVFSGEMLASMQKAVRDAPLDALLYLGPEAALTRSPAIPDTYLDAAYFQELSRRSVLLTGAPLSWSGWVARQGLGSVPYDAK